MAKVKRVKTLNQLVHNPNEAHSQFVVWLDERFGEIPIAESYERVLDVFFHGDRGVLKDDNKRAPTSEQIRRGKALVSNCTMRADRPFDEDESEKSSDQQVALVWRWSHGRKDPERFVETIEHVCQILRSFKSGYPGAALLATSALKKIRGRTNFPLRLRGRLAVPVLQSALKDVASAELVGYWRFYLKGLAEHPPAANILEQATQIVANHFEKAGDLETLWKLTAMVGNAPRAAQIARRATARCAMKDASQAIIENRLDDAGTLLMYCVWKGLELESMRPLIDRLAARACRTNPQAFISGLVSSEIAHTLVEENPRAAESFFESLLPAIAQHVSPAEVNDTLVPLVAKTFGFEPSELRLSQPAAEAEFEAEAYDGPPVGSEEWFTNRVDHVLGDRKPNYSYLGRVIARRAQSILHNADWEEARNFLFSARNTYPGVEEYTTATLVDLAGSDGVRDEGTLGAERAHLEVIRSTRR